MGSLSTLAKALLAGIGRMASIWPEVKVKGYPHRSELEALRADTKRIGDDMKRVLGRF